MGSGMTTAVVMAGFFLAVLLCCAGCTAPVSEETVSYEVIDERLMANYAIYTIEVTNEGYMVVAGLNLNVTVVDGPVNNPRTIASKVIEVGRIEPGESTIAVAEFSDKKLGGDDVRVLVELI
ncbi:MAG TPA: hypothetical protein ENN44_06770 [Methanoculleus sp.]|nr:hypothetical protein [Methanoculleus sp.]